jgi:hypothetical protein
MEVPAWLRSKFPPFFCMVTDLPRPANPRAFRPPPPPADTVIQHARLRAYGSTAGREGIVIFDDAGCKFCCSALVYDALEGMDLTLNVITNHALVTKLIAIIPYSYCMWSITNLRFTIITLLLVLKRKSTDYGCENDCFCELPWKLQTSMRFPAMKLGLLLVYKAVKAFNWIDSMSERNGSYLI